MEEPKAGREIILDLLRDKACNKQVIYKHTADTFKSLKKIVKQIRQDLMKQMEKVNKDVKIAYEDRGIFECSLAFGGDLLIFTMHTNIFTFDDKHFIHKSKYIQEDKSRSYCGLIQMYNFLTDSLKYNRSNDVGYLIGRIFINKDKHFFVEGKRQLGFLYNDLENMDLNKESLTNIIESAIIYCINFDLLSPPYQAVQEMTVSDKIEQSGVLTVKTGKRLGFQFNADNDRIE